MIHQRRASSQCRCPSDCCWPSLTSARAMQMRPNCRAAATVQRAMIAVMCVVAIHFASSPAMIVFVCRPKTVRAPSQWRRSIQLIYPALAARQEAKTALNDHHCLANDYVDKLAQCLPRLRCALRSSDVRECHDDSWRREARQTVTKSVHPSTSR